MPDTTDQIFIAGGIAGCSKSWNVSGPMVYDDWLKLYIPVRGEARILLEGKSYTLVPGDVYLFNSTKLQSQKYFDEFYHFWGHFDSVSPRYKQMFFTRFTIHQWKRTDVPGTKDIINGMKHFIDKKQQYMEKTGEFITHEAATQLIDDVFHFRLQSYLLWLIGDVLEKQKLEITSQEQSIIDKISPAIIYMDNNYLSSPLLKTIADTVFMAPNYFHRTFKKVFGISPYKYMLQKRLSESRQRLLHSNLSIKQIASICGYDDEFYFSKVFKKEYGMSPKFFRNSGSMS